MAIHSIVVQCGSKWWTTGLSGGEFIIHSWKTSYSYCLSPLASSPHQLWKTSGDHSSCCPSHYTWSLSSVSAYWLHGCMERLQQTHILAFCSSSSTAFIAMPFLVLRSLVPPPTATYAHFHQGIEARWRRPELAETDAENSPTAGRMKIHCCGEVCDHKGQSELDTSTEVWSRVFVSFHR